MRLVQTAALFCLAVAATASSASAQFGRCGLLGEGTLTVSNDLGIRVHIEVRNRSLGNAGADFAPHSRRSWAVCNRDDVVLRVSTPSDCGKTFMGESRSIRVYNQEHAHLGSGSFRFQVADWLQVGSTAAGFALTYVAQGYGVPPQLLSKLGVREADIYESCGAAGDSLTSAGQCIFKVFNYLPSDWKQKFRADSCISRAAAGVNLRDTHPYKFTNNCRYPVRLAIHYKDAAVGWTTKGWWDYAPGETAYLSSGGNRLRSDNSIWYYYAECTTANCRWSGERQTRIGNRTVPMMRKQDNSGENDWSITCTQ